MEDHKMTVEQLESGSAFCNCPLCGSVIKKILESKGGREKEEYWTWALEIAPSLPPGFMRNFNHSAGVITAVYVNGMTEREALQKSQGGCSVS